ncbi:PilT/PilU family type 4a pilus ATPase [Sulfurimonas sp. HSL3-7]|uniref:type IV pilus twitching motility protein PilT n=1 Tax=Sulfonitrofixus jiaomeiensis TaxID=3131938 RepID=UPI0031F965C1
MQINSDDAIEIFNRYLEKLIEKEGTDLHIKSNSVIRARIKGSIIPLGIESVSSDDVDRIVEYLLDKDMDKFKRDYAYDTIYILDEKHRFRVNLYYQLKGIAIVLRLIPHQIKSFEQLNLPSALSRISQLQRGLVLVTGTTGCGKSTTLASIVEDINRQSHRHVITIEDPIEYVYDDDKCVIEQRSIGQHAADFGTALRSALREDPDIIIVGELRDLETARNVLQAVNTGHLVFTTLHTLDAKETIDRLLAIFPKEEQERVRMDLAENLEVVISQRMLRDVKDNLIPAVELMFKSSRTQQLIASSREAELLDAMTTDHNSFGSIPMDNSLFYLTLEGKISEETAYINATHPTNLRLMFTTSVEYQKKIGAGSLDDAVMIKGDEEDNKKN